MNGEGRISSDTGRVDVGGAGAEGWAGVPPVTAGLAAAGAAGAVVEARFTSAAVAGTAILAQECMVMSSSACGIKSAPGMLSVVMWLPQS